MRNVDNEQVDNPLFAEHSFNRRLNLSNTGMTRPSDTAEFTSRKIEFWEDIGGFAYP